MSSDYVKIRIGSEDAEFIHQQLVYILADDTEQHFLTKKQKKAIIKLITKITDAMAEYKKDKLLQSLKIEEV